MKNFLMMCCLLALVATSFAAKKDEQNRTAQDVAQAKANLMLELRLNQLDQQMVDAKSQGLSTDALVQEYNDVMRQLGRTTPQGGSLDEGGEGCDDATNLGSALGEGVASGNTSGHTNEIGNAPSQPACYQGFWSTLRGNADDVTYRWTAPRTSTYTFSLCGSSYDCEISLWQYSCPLSFPEDYICGNDDAVSPCASGGLQSRLDCISLTQGQEVLIAIDGFNGSVGDYVLSIFDCAPECHEATLAAPGILESTTCDAGNDCESFSSSDIIVAVTIPYSGVWSFSYESLDGAIDPFLLIGTGCCVADICQDDDGGEGLNSLCRCIYLDQGTVYVTLESLVSTCGQVRLTVTEGDCNLGRCCYTEFTGAPGCVTTDQENCIILQGAWSEGLTCEENPCTIGRCCYYDDGEAVCDMTPQAFCEFALGGEWTEGASCNEACPQPGDCGPIDLVFAVDVTGSMQPAIDNIINELPNIIFLANAASGNDLRLGLVTIGGTPDGDDNLSTLHSLTTDIAAVEASIAALTANYGGNLPEATDEALREILTNDGSCTDGSDFTTAFRAGATKLIVLITDASNGGCDDQHDASDVIYGHQRALDAAGLGVRICSVWVPRPGAEPFGDILPVLNDYASTSAGSVRIVASDGAGTGGAINSIIAACGQGELRLSSNGVTLRCDPNGGGITTPTFDLHVTTLNDGTAQCDNVMLEITNIGGDFGTATINSPNPVALGNLGIGQSVNTPFNLTVTPDGDGGQMIVTVNLTSETCPSNFLDIVIDVPDCTPCDGDTAIYIFEDDLRIPPACICTYLCLGAPTHVFVCGTGFEMGRYPILHLTPGCLTEDCQEECNPAEYLFSNTGWTLWGDSCWHNLIIPQSDGCLCVCFERFLPVELNSFSALAHDREIELNWSTASETDNDHFEVMRDGVMAGHVEATNNASGSNYTFLDEGLENGRVYHYELVSVSVTGNREVVGNLESAPIAGAAVVTELALYQNFPNPFNPETNISFDLVEANNVTLKVYNAVGQEVALLVNSTLNAGHHNVVFDGSSLPSGLYFYRLTAGENTMQKKMLLLK
jgi:hypothetical protein